ncbi:alpha/beta hydrolase [Anoxybacterium hadale]|uniref:Alpha/beta hydrolase n=1 Tax=Anoxybacterium hadale TaxID=3408580 RepID=A0ACD1A6D6_9FIRM|nr:alpha/beta hydrolase [Clostridiales bacterium]
MKRSVYKTTEGRDKIRGYYNKVLSHFPFEQRYVETSYGQTFLLTTGEESNPPIILLHGSCSNSAFWFPELSALSENYRVFAVDIIGEAGNSEEYRPDLRADDFSLWLKEVLEAIGLKKAAIAGNSLGGWLAIKFAAAFPEKVSQLILIASAGLSEIRLQFLQSAEQSRQSDDTLEVDTDILGEQNIPKEALDFLNLIVENYEPIQELPVHSDDALYRLTMPVLYVGGENDWIIDSQASAQRLTRLVPSAELLLLPNLGHMITNNQKYIIPFLEKY